VQTEVFKERVKRLKEVNDAIEKLDPAIRSAAFSLLADYVTGITEKAKDGYGHHAANKPTEPDSTDFFSKLEKGKPADNAIAISAYFYSQYGAQPFQLDDIRTLADEVGLTIPGVLDMTLKQASRDGKSLFQHTGRNQYKPTVNGELYFQKTYSVKKGNKTRASGGNQS
jgi:hypothetical protein